MTLDLRIPMGLMFLIVGAILTIFGLVTYGDPMYARSVGVNLNLAWGLVMFVFGSTMFLLGRRSQKKAALEPPPPTTEPLGGRRPGGH